MEKRVAQDTKPIAQVIQELEDLKKILVGIGPTGTKHDPVQDVVLTQEELDAVLYKAKWEKYERERALMIGEINRRNLELFSSQWDAKLMWEFVNYNASNIKFTNGRSFVIDKDNQKVIWALCLFFTNDKRFVEYGKSQFGDENWSLDKGIFLRGDSGRGKSEIMKLFSRNPKMCYDFLPTHVIRKVAEDIGDAVISKFSLWREEPAGNWKVFFQRRIGFCWDDFGSEARLYGSSIMRRMIEYAYNLKSYPWWIRHMTSMLEYDEVEEQDGYHVRSRMREMFNDLILEGPDRR